MSRRTLGLPVRNLLSVTSVTGAAHSHTLVSWCRCPRYPSQPGRDSPAMGSDTVSPSCPPVSLQNHPQHLETCDEYMDVVDGR